jgi:hypothetical protein
VPSSSPPPTSRPSSLRFFTYLRPRQVGVSSPAGRSCRGMSTEETRGLWCCMLELQQLYGCYNSTRIDLAVNAGEAGIDLMRRSFLPPPCPWSGAAAKSSIVSDRLESDSANWLRRAAQVGRGITAAG